MDIIQASSIITHDGDTVDLISVRYFGTTNMTEKILEANPGLAARGTSLPMGVTVILPPHEQPTQSNQVNLWD